EITRAGLGAFARAQAARLGLRRGVRALQCASFSFDAAVLELCLVWPAGGVLVLPPAGPVIGADLAGWLSRADVALVIPGVLAGVDPGAVSGLDTLLVGAEACGADLVE